MLVKHLPLKVCFSSVLAPGEEYPPSDSEQKPGKSAGSVQERLRQRDGRVFADFYIFFILEDFLLYITILSIIVILA